MAKNTTKNTEGQAPKGVRKPPATRKTAAQKKAEAEAKLKQQQLETGEGDNTPTDTPEQPNNEPTGETAEKEVTAGASESSAGQEGKTTETDKIKSDANPPVGNSTIEDLSDDEFDKGKRDGVSDDVEDQELMEGQMKLEDDGSTKIGDNPMLTDTKDKEEVQPFVRKTKIEKTSSNVSIKSLFKEWKKDQALRAKYRQEAEEAIKSGLPAPEFEDETTLRFDLAIQRNETWTDYQKSDLIHTVLYGYYLQPVLVEDSNDGKKWFIDGKQRLTTLMTFIEGQWALSKKTKPVYGYKIAGFKFNDLPSEMQDEIMDETITLVRIKNMTVAERDEMFVKQNSGTPLSKIELIRAMHSELSEQIDIELSSLKFFKEDLELTKKAKDKFIDVELILQIAMLIEEGKDRIKGLGADNYKEYVLRLKETEQIFSDEMIEKISNISNYLTLAFEDYEMDEVKKALKKVNVPIIFWTAITAMDDNLQPKLFGDFIRSFLISGYSVESAYGKSSQAGSSKKENVLIRLDEMSAALSQFIDMIRNASSIEEGVEQFNKHLADVNGVDREEGEDGERESA
ncbi:DUF262 domain-containing protein [Paenibacillus lautus]|uniref:DUF262 domain-containing protein n=1 Tax=Paenibacillus lautus TaxID=1401 RepID=UPI003D2ABDDA